ncbi:hypothetical protein [Comamonas sp. JC664]|uniref:hypothetical protein n=1 Tax=Comamonas sp. JC664 TaxID=2801917 RepID=UPI001748D68C|nr:hypothetical protein [Comamonas sp. JC664]MBL0697168.1 hypothetical protein [Comamonas sp. JC664]GHG82906.1 hypothetical protein GCM10012319_37390 [Comamonas sp. KCTC 72670]
MRTLLMVGLAVVGLQFGCGVDGGAGDAPLDVSSSEAPLVRCLTDSLTVYYSDATYSTEVGSDRCFCGSTPIRSGSRTPYFVEYINGEC